MSYERSRLWKYCFAIRSEDEFERERSWLRVELQRARDRAALVAAEIPRDLPGYTVHDVSHLDALWDVADIIIGDRSLLTPAEGYLLGLSFLLHDLGMGAAARLGGITSVRKSPLWAEASLLERRSAGLSDTASLDPDAIARVDEFVLRRTHAQYATHLAIQEWRDEQGRSFYIIDDAELRSIFGELAGEIAYSHWWPIEQVATRFDGPPLGAPATLPHDWTMDAFRVAALLRCSDAAHIDARRAPTFLRLIRAVQGYSRLHWIFQERLQRPIVDGDLLRYSSTRSIPAEDADAWWLAFDAINMIDAELLSCDGYLRGEPGRRFAVRGVVGAQRPRLFAQCLKPQNWKPIDARPYIDDVPRIISALGGVQLFGRNYSSPVRELLQNAVDATCAAKAMDTSGTEECQPITVFLDKDAVKLVVSDHGIGMSERVVIEGLLNFGRSFWRAIDFSDEYKGIDRKSFRPAGRFGIGFFSTFILGDRVRVVTRRFDVGVDQAVALVFRDGLKARPLLGNVSDVARPSIGTQVEVDLNEDAFEDLVRSMSDEGFGRRIMRLARWAIAPVDLMLDSTGKRSIAISSGRPFSEYSDRSFFDKSLVLQRERRLPFDFGPSDDKEVRVATRFRDNIRFIVERDGSLIGRGALYPSGGHSQSGTMVDDAGLWLRTIAGFIGVCRGVPTQASRDSCNSLASRAAVTAWAEEQLALIEKMSNISPREQVDLAAQFARGGLYSKRLAICTIGKSIASYNDVVKWAATANLAIIVRFSTVAEFESDFESVLLLENVFVAQESENNPLAILGASQGEAEYSDVGECTDVIVLALQYAWPDAVIRAYEPVVFGERSPTGAPASGLATVVARDEGVDVKSVVRSR